MGDFDAGTRKRPWLDAGYAGYAGDAGDAGVPYDGGSVLLRRVMDGGLDAGMAPAVDAGAPLRPVDAGTLKRGRDESEPVLSVIRRAPEGHWIEVVDSAGYHQRLSGNSISDVRRQFDELDQRAKRDGRDLPEISNGSGAALDEIVGPQFRQQKAQKRGSARMTARPYVPEPEPPERPKEAPAPVVHLPNPPPGWDDHDIEAGGMTATEAVNEQARRDAEAARALSAARARRAALAEQAAAAERAAAPEPAAAPAPASRLSALTDAGAYDAGVPDAGDRVQGMLVNKRTGERVPLVGPATMAHTGVIEKYAREHPEDELSVEGDSYIVGRLAPDVRSINARIATTRPLARSDAGTDAGVADAGSRADGGADAGRPFSGLLGSARGPVADAGLPTEQSAVAPINTLRPSDDEEAAKDRAFEEKRAREEAARAEEIKKEDAASTLRARADAAKAVIAGRDASMDAGPDLDIEAGGLTATEEVNEQARRDAEAARARRAALHAQQDAGAGDYFTTIRDKLGKTVTLRGESPEDVAHQWEALGGEKAGRIMDGDTKSWQAIDTIRQERRRGGGTGPATSAPLDAGAPPAAAAAPDQETGALSANAAAPLSAPPKKPTLAPKSGSRWLRVEKKDGRQVKLWGDSTEALDGQLEKGDTVIQGDEESLREFAPHLAKNGEPDADAGAGDDMDAGAGQDPVDVAKGVVSRNGSSSEPKSVDEALDQAEAEVAATNHATTKKQPAKKPEKVKVSPGVRASVMRNYNAPVKERIDYVSDLANQYANQTDEIAKAQEEGHLARAKGFDEQAKKLGELAEQRRKSFERVQQMIAGGGAEASGTSGTGEDEPQQAYDPETPGKDIGPDERRAREQRHADKVTREKVYKDFEDGQHLRGLSRLAEHIREKEANPPKSVFSKVMQVITAAIAAGPSVPPAMRAGAAALGQVLPERVLQYKRELAADKGMYDRLSQVAGFSNRRGASDFDRMLRLESMANALALQEIEAAAKQAEAQAKSEEERAAAREVVATTQRAGKVQAEQLDAAARKQYETRKASYTPLNILEQQMKDGELSDIGQQVYAERVKFMQEMEQRQLNIARTRSALERDKILAAEAMSETLRGKKMTEAELKLDQSTLRALGPYSRLTKQIQKGEWPSDVAMSFGDLPSYASEKDRQQRGDIDMLLKLQHFALSGANAPLPEGGELRAAQNLTSPYDDNRKRGLMDLLRGVKAMDIVGRTERIDWMDAPLSNPGIYKDGEGPAPSELRPPGGPSGVMPPKGGASEPQQGGGTQSAAPPQQAPRVVPVAELVKQYKAHEAAEREVLMRQLQTGAVPSFIDFYDEYNRVHREPSDRIERMLQGGYTLSPRPPELVAKPPQKTAADAGAP